VLQLINAVLNRACNAGASVESRTACAITLACLSRDPACAAALMHLQVPPRLLDAAAAVRASAASAALRRECVRAVWTLVAASAEHARLAARMGVHVRAGMLGKPGYKGFDSAFDRFVAHVEELTHPAKVNTSNNNTATATAVGGGDEAKTPSAGGASASAPAGR
jgi:hypothetical protein